VVSTRAIEFKRTPPNHAGPLELKKAFRILKRLATNLIREDQTSKLDYQKIQEDIAWAKAVIPDFDIAMTTSNSNKRERSIETAQPASKKAKITNRSTWSRSFAEVVKDRKIIGVIDQSDKGGRIPRNQWGLVRRALASVALKVLDENPGPPPDCTDAGWYQDYVKLIACEDERSAALYKAAINKVGEVYPGAKLAVCDAEDIPPRPKARGWLPSEPSEPGAILSLLTRFNPKLPTDGWKVQETERVTMNVVILLNQTCLETLTSQQNRVNYGSDKVQLRIYDTDKLASDDLAACASYEPPSDDEMEHEEATLTGYVSPDSELTESLKQLCTQDSSRPGCTVLQYIAEEAEGTQLDQGPKNGAVPTD